eukprot:maker-scaffold_56-snap-gene-0.0-mRNA-1 protein AED:0.13 eAED:0.13 QI:84/1/0.66/1/1/1/3/69/408
MSSPDLPKHIAGNAETEIQAELQDYLEKKGLNDFFVKLVQEILLQRPENPIEYIVQHLFTKYPEETAKFQKGFVGDLTKSTSEKPREEKELSDDDEDDYSTEDDDAIGDLPEIEVREVKPGAKSRRISVSAGVLSMKETKEADQEVHFEKSPQEEQELRKILSSNLLCSHLHPDDLQKIINACEKQEFEPDMEIIKEGDEKAEHYFIIENGTAVVFKGEKQVCEYKDGDAFGELALMYNAPRAATVKSTSKLNCWKLGQKLFKTILMGSAMKRREKCYEFLAQVPIFAELADIEKKTLVEALKEKVLKQDEIICKQGEAGNDFFIISKGSVKVEVNNQEIGELKEGQYFGEIALLTKKPRQATISAKTDDVTLLCVDRKAFQRVLGPLSDILKRNMKTYSQYVAGVSM